MLLWSPCQSPLWPLLLLNDVMPGLLHDVCAYLCGVPS
jgi:hypothetical protein